MDMSNQPKDEIVFGATVVVKDLDFGDTEEFTLVGAGEEEIFARSQRRDDYRVLPYWIFVHLGHLRLKKICRRKRLSCYFVTSLKVPFGSKVVTACRCI